MKELKVETVSVESLREYENNAKVHTPEQIEQIKKSIQDFGFNDPIGIWKNQIVEGHGRLIAAKELGMRKVPVIRLDHMTDEQRKAYTLVHNKLTMNTDFDFSILDEELEELRNIDMTAYGFDQIESEASDWFQNRTRYDNAGNDEESEEYQDFVEKFEIKRTTDDCYTPDNIYEAVADWAAKQYNLSRDNFVRPFYPGGDYKREKYKAGDIVVDNPPFSILSEILTFYEENGIKFFLFAPTLTLFGSGRKLDKITYLPTAIKVTYENGAKVNTSFITNLDKCIIRVSSDLFETVDKAEKENRGRNPLPKYDYPDNVLTAAKMSHWSQCGINCEVYPDEVLRISELDAQKGTGKSLYGGGFLGSERVAELTRQAEKTCDDNFEQSLLEENERRKEARLEGEKGKIIWELSEREREIVAQLGKNHHA